nr:MAG TPA: hypothetical protein [Caudoviricetes sp.]
MSNSVELKNLRKSHNNKKNSKQNRRRTYEKE